jgi:2-polyprenyl-3-methyl-5-hydroxy-6-metoxy-1,4-benzoquinol methylase
MTENEIHQALKRYKFYHIIKIKDNIYTPGYPDYVPTQNLVIKHLKTLNLKGKRVLDIGCRDGLFSFTAEQMGAEEVIGIDNDLSKPATEFLIPYFKSNVKMIQMNLYDLKPENFGLFDVVIFPGVLYHLRYPFWGLKAIRDVLRIGGNLLIDTPIWEGERNNAILFCPIGKESPYEQTSCTFFNEKGLVDTLISMGLETVAIEYIKRNDGFINVLKKRFRNMSLLGKDSPPIKKINRGTFHAIFRGYDKETFLMKYWDDTHNCHTESGFNVKSQDSTES